MTKTQREKIGVPFHPLTKEEIKQWYQDKLLTSAGYLLAIKKVTRPPGTSLVIPNVLKFCKQWEISKSAFYRAVNELRQKGYTDWEATQGIVLQETQKIISFPSQENCPTCGTDSHERDADSHERDADSHERDADSHERDADSHERDADSHEWENKRLKPLPNKASSAPSDNSDYSYFIQTLSEDERESFLEFGKKKAAELKNPPVQLPFKWIEAHFEELKGIWEKHKSSTGSTHCGAAVSTNAPTPGVTLSSTNAPTRGITPTSTNVHNYESWSASSHEGQYHTLMNLGLAKFCENAISKAWYEWASAKHPERFVNVPD